MTEIANAMACHREIAVITATQNHSEDENPRYEIIRISKLFIKEKNLFLKAVNHLFLGLKYMFHLSLKVKSHDALFIVTNPSTLLIIASLIVILKRCNLTVLVYDVFPENYAVVSCASKKTFTYKALVKIFNYSYCSAKTLISIGDDMTSLLRAKLPKYKGKIIKITNWSETNEVVPNKNYKNEIITCHGLQDKTIFAFAGNIGRLQNIQFLVDTFNQYIPSEAHLLFIGGGAMVDYVKSAARRKNANVTYAGTFPRGEQAKFLNACDIAIVSLAEGMHGLGVPSKAYNIMAAGKPILFVGEEGSEIYKMVNKHKIGWETLPGNREKLAETVDYILANPDEIKQKGVLARQLSVRKYNKNLILKKYVSHFESIIS